MFFWHLGGTVAFVRYAFRDERMDLRFLMLGAILSDLIDTPIGFVLWQRFENVRLAAHSIAFATLIMVLVLAWTRRGRPRKRWMPIAIGVLLHLVLDAMWGQPETLWWPFLGWEFNSTGLATVSEYLRALLTDWRMWLGEVIGIGYLAILAKRSGLGDSGRRRLFITTGRVDARIGDG